MLQKIYANGVLLGDLSERGWGINMRQRVRHDHRSPSYSRNGRSGRLRVSKSKVLLPGSMAKKSSRSQSTTRRCSTTGIFAVPGGFEERGEGQSGNLFRFLKNLALNT